MLIYLARTLCGLLILFSVLRQEPLSAVPPSNGAQATASGGQVIAARLADNIGAASGPDGVLHRVYRITAYCDRGLTAAGVPSGYGQCAAPADIPFGSRIYIPELQRTFVVTDRTARRFRRNTVDLFMPSRTNCKQFGCQYLECEIVLPAERIRYGSPSLLDDGPQYTRS